MTEGAPMPIGPYSQAIDIGSLVFCAGQVGLDPVTGEMVEGVAAQAERAMRNLGAVLAAGGLEFDDVVKTTIFLADFGDFGTVNGIYGAYFTGAPPARSTVAVKTLPKGGLVEIEVIAARSAGPSNG
ncbi:MAG: RidA family protein [Candidatus Limnocylindrales bacterium]